MRLTVAVAALLMAMPGEAADLDALCAGSRHRSAINVSFTDTAVEIDETLAATELQAQFHEHHGVPNYAFTRATLVRDVRLRLDGYTEERTGRACLWPRIDINLRLEPLRVHLARELSAEQCFRYHVLEHELAHVAIYQAAVRNAVPALQDELRSALGTERYEGQTDRLMSELREKLTTQWLPRLDALVDAAEAEHDRLDAEEQERALQVCSGAALRVMRAAGIRTLP